MHNNVSTKDWTIDAYGCFHESVRCPMTTKESGSRTSVESNVIESVDVRPDATPVVITTKRGISVKPTNIINGDSKNPKNTNTSNAHHSGRRKQQNK